MSMEPKLKLFEAHVTFIRPAVREVICPEAPRRADQGTVLVVAADKAAAMAAASPTMSYPADLKLIRSRDRHPTMERIFDAGIATMNEPVVLAWQAIVMGGNRIVRVSPDGSATHVATFRYPALQLAIEPVEETNHA